jgi:hypothetical protein
LRFHPTTSAAAATTLALALAAVFIRKGITALFFAHRVQQHIVYLPEIGGGRTAQHSSPDRFKVSFGAFGFTLLLAVAPRDAVEKGQKMAPMQKQTKQKNTFKTSINHSALTRNVQPNNNAVAPPSLHLLFRKDRFRPASSFRHGTGSVEGLFGGGDVVRVDVIFQAGVVDTPGTGCTSIEKRSVSIDQTRHCICT